MALFVQDKSHFGRVDNFFTISNRLIIKRQEVEKIWEDGSGVYPCQSTIIVSSQTFGDC